MVLLLFLLFTHSLDPCLWGESDYLVFGQPASISLQLASSSTTPAGSVHKSRGDHLFNGTHIRTTLCAVCMRVCVLQMGHSGDGCDLASTLCKYDLRKGDLFFYEFGKGATSEAGKSLFRAANVWWGCAQYFVIASCG